MRQITARQKQILMFLLKTKNGMTAAKLAEEVQTSVRTVHRELDELNQTLITLGLELHRKSGTGISISAKNGEPITEEKLQEIEVQLLSNREKHYSVDERKIILFCDLIEADEPIKMFALANGLKVTVATVSSDLDELEHQVERFNLHIMRRRGYGVQLIGDEGTNVLRSFGFLLIFLVIRI